MAGAFLKEFKDGSFIVSGGEGAIGNAADVYADDNFVSIVTDSSEGHAHLDIKALPMLIEALQKIAARQKVAA